MRHASAPVRLPRQVLVVLSGMAVAGLVSAGPAAPPAAAQTTDSVTVNATSGLGTIPADAIGLNTAVYDGYMNDTPIPGLLKAAGVDALRYPGGSYSDIYNWQTGTAAAGGYVAPNTGFSSFMTTAKAVGAQPIITVNYGTGTPSPGRRVGVQRAASNDGVKYWEVGNEVYGNGTYGANWEADAHCDTSPSGGPVTIGSEPSQTYDCGPGTYAAGVAQYDDRDARRRPERQGLRRAHHPRVLAGRGHQRTDQPAAVEPDGAHRARLEPAVRRSCTTTPAAPRPPAC